MNISIVIPVLNEQPNIENAVTRAWEAGADEVIVVDGGSTDGTLDQARTLNVQLVESAPGRGIQQQTGAKFATGDIILFLHADTWLDPDACEQIRSVADSHCEFCGAFEQHISNKAKIYRWIEKGNAFRIRFRGLFYGDQGIFVTRETLQRIGGYPDAPLMEDIILAQKLRRVPKLLLPGRLHVDPRRWARNGPITQTILNWAFVAAFYVGVSPQQLARWYYGRPK